MVFCIVVFELMSRIAMDSAQMILAIPTGFFSRTKSNPWRLSWRHKTVTLKFRGAWGIYSSRIWGLIKFVPAHMHVQFTAFDATLILLFTSGAFPLEDTQEFPFLFFCYPMINYLPWELGIQPLPAKKFHLFWGFRRVHPLTPWLIIYFGDKQV